MLRGRRALVTGGTSGIGYEIARQLGMHGAAVTVMGRREAVAADQMAKLEAMRLAAIEASPARLRALCHDGQGGGSADARAAGFG